MGLFSLLYTGMILLQAVLLLLVICGGHSHVSHVYTTSEDEQVALDEFKISVSALLVQDFMKSDGYLIRWLTASDFDVQDAVEKLRKSLEWRKANNVDSVLFENFTSIYEMYPYYMESFDKDGRPILIVPFGIYNIRKITLAGMERLYHRYFIRMYEVCEMLLYQLRQNSDTNVNQFRGIFDMTGFNVKLGGCFKCLGMIPELVSNFDLNYPGLCYKAFLINTPTLFDSALKIGKSFMSERTKESLESFDYNKLKWSTALLEQNPADQLPLEYGGTRPSLHLQSFQMRNRSVAQTIQTAADQDKNKSKISHKVRFQDENTVETGSDAPESTAGEVASHRLNINPSSTETTSSTSKSKPNLNVNVNEVPNAFTNETISSGLNIYVEEISPTKIRHHDHHHHYQQSRATNLQEGSPYLKRSHKSGTVSVSLSSRSCLALLCHLVLLTTIL